MVLVFGIFITTRNTVQCLTWTGQNNADKRSKAADVTARTQNQAFLLSARAFHRTLKDHADLKFTGVCCLPSRKEHNIQFFENEVLTKS